MKIDHAHAKRLISSARPNSVDGVVLAKSASQKDKDEALKFLMGNVKSKIKSKECIVITIETQ